MNFENKLFIYLQLIPNFVAKLNLILKENCFAMRHKSHKSHWKCRKGDENFVRRKCFPILFCPKSI